MNMNEKGDDDDNDKKTKNNMNKKSVIKYLLANSEESGNKGDYMKYFLVVSSSV